MSDTPSPPSNTPGERALLGSILISSTPNATFELVDEFVSPSDFHDPANQIIYEHMERLQREGKAIDVILLVESLKALTAKDIAAYEVVGGGDYLASLIHGVPNDKHAKHYALLVRETSSKRQLQDIGHRMVQAVDRGQPITEIVAASQMDLANLGNHSSRLKFNRITAADLASATFEVDYLIEGVLCANHSCGWIGGSKTLKTTVGLDLGISLATGRPFLGYFPVARKCRVGIMSGESGMPTLKETALRIAAAANVNLAEIEGLIFSDTLPQLHSPEHLAALRRWLIYDGIEVLFLDPAYLCMQVEGRESSLFAIGGILRGVSDLCRELGVTFILAHHATQASGRDFTPPKLSDVAWAGFEQFFRQWVCLKRRKSYEIGTGQHELWLGTGGSMGHSGLYSLDIYEGVNGPEQTRVWQVGVSSPSEALDADERRKERQKRDREAKKNDENRRRLLNALREFPDGETAKVLRETSGLNSENFGLSITCLRRDGLAESCTVPKANGRGYEGYKLTGTDRDAPGQS